MLRVLCFGSGFGVSEYSLMGVVALVFICVSSVVLVWVCI